MKLFTTAAAIAILFAGPALAASVSAGLGGATAGSASTSAGVAATGAAGAFGSGGLSGAFSNNANTSTGSAGVGILTAGSTPENGIAIVDTGTASSSDNVSASGAFGLGNAAGIAAGFTTGAGFGDAQGIAGTAVINLQP